MSEFLGSLYTTYAYDPLGNRTLKNDSGALTSYAYNAGNAQILLTPPSSGLPTTSSYDANGNLTQENTGGALTINGWDPENRLLTATASGQTQSYTYSANGQRQLKLVGAQTTYFVWDGENVLQEANASLVTNVAYVQAPGGWGGLIRQQGTQTQAYFGFDFEGSTRLLVRPNGTVVTAYDYKAFGEELQTGSSGSSYRYGGAWGYYRDLPTRLYIRARHLRTDLGRWISKDPIGFDGGDWNLYRYVGNRAINVDPSGLTCSCVSGNCPKPYENDVSPGAWGGTTCDTRSGKMYSVILPPDLSGTTQYLVNSVTTCLIKHEAVHRADRMKCCKAQAAGCKTTAPRKSALHCLMIGLVRQ